MSSNKIYLKIPIGVIYYVCDPLTPRRNLYIMKNADYFCDRLWKKLLAEMPEIEPLGGLRLYIHRQYSLPPRSDNNRADNYKTTSDSLTEEERNQIGVYIGEIKAEQQVPGTIVDDLRGGFPMFFFRCPHPEQARLGLSPKKSVKKGESFGETVFLWGHGDDMDVQEDKKRQDLDDIIDLLYRTILFHWRNREDIGITPTNALKYPLSDNPNLRFESFKRAVWRGEAFIQKLIYLNPEFQNFGIAGLSDEFVFDRITDSKGKSLNNICQMQQIPIDMYSLGGRDSESGEFVFYSTVLYYSSQGGSFTNALFSDIFNDFYHSKSNLFSKYFPKIEDQNKAIDYYLELENKEREEESNYYSHLIESIKSCDNIQEPEKETSMAKEVKETKLKFKSLHFFNEKLFSTDDRKHELMETLQPIIEQVKEKQDWYAVLRGAQSVEVVNDKFGKKHKVLADKASGVAMFDDLCMLMPELAENANIFPIDGKEAKATPSSKYNTLRKAVSAERTRWTLAEKGELLVQDWEKTEYIPSRNVSIPGKRINNKEDKYGRMLKIGKNVKEALEQLRDKYIQS